MKRTDIYEVSPWFLRLLGGEAVSDTNVDREGDEMNQRRVGIDVPDHCPECGKWLCPGCDIIVDPLGKVTCPQCAGYVSGETADQATKVIKSATEVIKGIGRDVADIDDRLRKELDAANDTVTRLDMDLIQRDKTIEELQNNLVDADRYRKELEDGLRRLNGVIKKQDVGKQMVRVAQLTKELEGANEAIVVLLDTMATWREVATC